MGDQQQCQRHDDCGLTNFDCAMGREQAGHPNHQPDTSKPLDPTEGACTCGYVGRAATAAAHIDRCAAWWTARAAANKP